MDLSKMCDLCKVLGLDLLQRIRDEIDESVRDIDSWVTTGLRAETIHRLNSCVEGLSNLKLERFTEIKKKALAVISYWDALLMPFEKKQELISVLYYVQVESENEINEANALSLEFVSKVEKEYHKLREQINSLVMKKKTKLLEILKTTHLTSSFINKDIADPLAALSDIRKQISELKELAFQRAETVTKIELIQYAGEEIDRYRNSENTDVALHNERTVKVKTMVKNLEAQLIRQADPFIYDDVDALKVLRTVAKRIDATSTEKAGTSTSAEKITEDKQSASADNVHVEPEAQPLQPLQPAQPLQPLQPAQPLPIYATSGPTIRICPPQAPHTSRASATQPVRREHVRI